MDELSIAQVASLVREVPDFPKPGIAFKDITPVLGDARALRSCISHMAVELEGKGVDVIAGIESRGFIFGTALALHMGVGFVPVRKPGKLPREVASQPYTLEYGQDTVEVHKEDIRAGMRVALVDDLIATGGTAQAACKLLSGLGAEIVAALFVIELKSLNGRQVLPAPVASLIRYD